MSRLTRALAVLASLLGSAAPGQAFEVPIIPAQVIETGADGASALALGDLDLDGDPDVLAASALDGDIAWYANDGGGSFGAAQPLATSAGASGVAVGDLDRDGDLDVVWSAAGTDTVAWQANDGSGSFAAPVALDAAAVGASAVALADLDRDGSLDVLAALGGAGEVVWYPNDGAGGFGAAQLLASGASGASAVRAADVDRDGLPDVLWGAAMAGTIAWQRNDGGGVFDAAQPLPAAAPGVASLDAADLDRDGALDVLAASRFDNTVGWFRNLDGQGSFGPRQVVATAAFAASAVAADLDRDGDPDVLAAAKFAGVFWYQNDGEGSFGPAHTIATGIDGAARVLVGDLDRDGDPDVLAAFESSNEVAWYENDDLATSLALREPQVVSSDAIPAVFVTALDVDRDGDADLAVARNLSGGMQELVWHANDGAGSFSAEIAIATLAAGGTTALAAADVDGNGTTDLLASGTSMRLFWLSNQGGTFAPVEVIDAFAGDAALALRSGDLDGDGDLDLAIGFESTGVGWYENQDGAGDFGPRLPIVNTIAGATSLELADWDRDGDLDLLAVGADDGELVWFENDGLGSFSAEQLLIRGSGTLNVADFDGDGDPDVRLGTSWLEGCPNPVCPVNPVPHSATARAVDADQDGDVDLWRSGGTRWMENSDGLGTFAPLEGVAPAGLNYESNNLADFDRDGDADLAGRRVFTGVVWLPSLVRQPVYLTSADLRPGEHLIEGMGFAVLKVEAQRVGGSTIDTELAALALRFEESPGIPLTTTQANALIASIEVYRDDGSTPDELDPGDPLVVQIAPLDLDAGVETIALPDGSALSSITPGEVAPFLFKFNFAPSAAGAVPSSFVLTHAGAQAVAERRDLDLAIPVDPGPDLSLVIDVVTIEEAPDLDGDGIPDLLDPCRFYFNEDLLDRNGDGIPNDCQCGDANLNDTVDNGDVTRAFLCVQNPGSASCLAAMATGKADANNNNLWDSNDINQIYAGVSSGINYQITCANRPEGTPPP